MKSIVNSLGVVKTWKFWKEMLIMTVGMFIAAAAIYYFQVPGKIVLGTVSGLAIFLSEVLSWSGIVLKVSTIIVILNAFLIVLALLLLGKDFGLKTVYTALIAGPLMDLWEWIKPYQELSEEGQTSVMGDPFLDVICFVIVLSASQAILFHINASSGGLDIIAKIINNTCISTSAHPLPSLASSSAARHSSSILSAWLSSASSGLGSMGWRWTISPQDSTSASACASYQSTTKRYGAISSISSTEGAACTK